MPVGEAFDAFGVGMERQRRPLPYAPCPRTGKLLGLIVAGQAPVIGGHQVAALGFRDRRDEVLPGIGKERVGPLLIEPLELARPQRENAAQDDLADTGRMRLGIGERERRAPGTAAELPALEPEMFAQPLHVGHKIPGRVLGKLGMRRRLPAAALVEQDDSIGVRIVRAPHRRVGAATRPAMHDDDRFALWIAAFLEIDAVQIGHFQRAGPIGLDLGVERPSAHRFGRRVGHGVLSSKLDRQNQLIEYATEISSAASPARHRLPFFWRVVHTTD